MDGGNYFSKIHQFVSPIDVPPLFAAGYWYDSAIWTVLTHDSDPDKRVLCVGKTGCYRTFQKLQYQYISAIVRCIHICDNMHIMAPYCVVFLLILLNSSTGFQYDQQSINQSINAEFVGRRYTTRPGAPAESVKSTIKKYILESVSYTHLTLPTNREV